jgi:hypothetical protein
VKLAHTIHPSLHLQSPQNCIFGEGMTISCNTRGMYALLCGSLFDHQVACNLVSPWFQPIPEIISPLVKGGEFEKVATIMGKRQPKLAALWMGATISGMATAIFQGVRIGLTAIELHASA